MNNFYLYFLRRPDKIDPMDESKDQPFYVGKGCNGRMGDHRKQASGLFGKPGRKPYKIQIIHKLWKSGLDFQEEIILDSLSEQDALDLEVAAIEQYGRKDNGTGILANVTDGGDGVSGLIHSDETKKILREKRLLQAAPMLGKKHSPETIQKILEARKGFRHTDEAKQAIGEAARNRSEETLEKIRNASRGRTHMRGKKLPEEVKRKIGESNKGKHFYWLGKSPTEEHREKISKSLKGRPKPPMTEETKEKLRQAWLIRKQRPEKKRTEEQKQRMREAQALRYKKAEI